jgi:hypothetical protein
MTVAYRIVVERLGGKTPLRRSRHRCEDNVKVNDNVKVETGYRDVDWNHLAQDRDRQQGLVTTAVNLRVPQKS